MPIWVSLSRITMLPLVSQRMPAVVPKPPKIKTAISRKRLSDGLGIDSSGFTGPLRHVDSRARLATTTLRCVGSIRGWLSKSEQILIPSTTASVVALPTVNPRFQRLWIRPLVLGCIPGQRLQPLISPVDSFVITQLRQGGSPVAKGLLTRGKQFVFFDPVHENCALNRIPAINTSVPEETVLDGSCSTGRKAMQDFLSRSFHHVLPPPAPLLHPIPTPGVNLAAF